MNPSIRARWIRVSIVSALLALALPAWADTGNTPRFSWQGWGLRAGVANDTDIDQVVGGAQFNLGEVYPHLRFQPDFELGAGDDATTVYGTAPLYYRFQTDWAMIPYAGGGLALGWVDWDDPTGATSGDSEFEVGARATGGLEWPRPNGQAFFVEMSLGFGDVHELQAVAAWAF
jgi:opacity protein-like surface antigen